MFIRAVAERKEALDDFHCAEFGGGLSEDEGTRLKDKRVTAWKIARWSVGHALMAAGREDEAIGAFKAILEDGLDGPAIRADLAVLAAKRGDDSAVEHARKAIALGVSEDKVREMEVVISQFCL